MAPMTSVNLFIRENDNLVGVATVMRYEPTGLTFFYIIYSDGRYGWESDDNLKKKGLTLTVQ